MKKLILLLSCILLQVSAAYAASQLHVVAMDEFKTDKPSKILVCVFLNLLS